MPLRIQAVLFGLAGMALCCFLLATTLPAKGTVRCGMEPGFGWVCSR